MVSIDIENQDKFKIIVIDDTKSIHQDYRKILESGCEESVLTKYESLFFEE